MIFRKKTKVTDFLEGPFLDEVLLEKSFRYENFHEEFFREHGIALSDVIHRQSAVGGKDDPGAVKQWDQLTPGFIGAFLWLLKYRTLSTNRNTPRKLAFLDMLFDIEMPRLIDRHLGAYDTARIKETYDIMDIKCKKEYTSEIAEGGPPPFIVSPIWAKDVRPSPFKIAAKIYLQIISADTPIGSGDPDPGEKLTEELTRHFILMTDPVEKASAKINFSWAAPREEADLSPSGNDQQHR